MTAATFWDKRAAKYAKDPIKDEAAYEYGLERAAAHLTQDMKALEFGCGTGMTALKLAPHVDHYLGTDISEGMVDQCRVRAQGAFAQNVDFKAATLNDPTLPTGGFDAVLGFNILHLIDDVDGAIVQVHRLLKPGGVVITKTVCAPERPTIGFRAMMAMAWIYTKLNSGLFVRIEPIARLDQRFIDAGFDILETGNFPINPPSRFIVARKR